MYKNYDKKGDSIEGVLISIQENVGTNASKVYNIKKSSGDVMSVWGSAVLDGLMALIEVGSQIRITYQGLGDAKSGKNAPKLFEVEVDKD